MSENKDAPGGFAAPFCSACVWTEDNWTGDYDTQCGQRQCFFDGGPVENKYAFCPYCGNKITPNDQAEPRPGGKGKP